MEENNHYYKLISAFLSKQASEGQISDLREWLSASEGNRLEFEELKEVWQKSRIKYQAENIDSLYSKVEKEMLGAGKGQGKTVEHSRPKRRYIHITKWAAAAVIIIGILSVFQFYDQKANQEHLTLEQEIIRENPAGRKTTVRLSDGTIVWLNSESKLYYNTMFGKKDRHVQLEGEAFFEVAKNEKLPFKVFSRGQVIEALGTAFNVRGFSYESQLKVALVEGTVKIQEEKETSQRSIILEPGDEFEKHFVSGKISLGKLNQGELSWKDGNIYFKSASMPEVFRTLERWYGVEISIDDSIDQSWNYTGEFSKETLENVLRSISYSKKFDFEIVEKKVIVKPKKKKLYD